VKKVAHDIEIAKDIGFGCNLPGATRFKLELSSPNTRLRDYFRQRTSVVSALRQGDHAYVHRLAGVHRAAVASALLRRDPHGESFETACQQVESVRNVDLREALEGMEGPWIDQVMQQPLVCPLAVELWGASESMRSKIFHACRTNEGSIGPLCRWKQSGAATFSGPFVTTHDVLDLEGHKLCKNCAPLIPPTMAA
jgi:hypothetical protein